MSPYEKGLGYNQIGISDINKDANIGEIRYDTNNEFFNANNEKTYDSSHILSPWPDQYPQPPKNDTSPNTNTTTTTNTTTSDNNKTIDSNTTTIPTNTSSTSTNQSSTGNITKYDPLSDPDGNDKGRGMDWH